MPPEEITKLIEEALSWCRQHKSVKGAHALLSLVLSYQLGLPVKRVASVRMTVQDVLDSVADMDEEQFDAAVEALYQEVE